MTCSAIRANTATPNSPDEKAAIHLNDTHPAVSVAELMRLRWTFTASTSTPLGHHQRHIRLHQPYAAARGAGKLAGAAVRATAARHMQIVYAINAQVLEARAKGFNDDQIKHDLLINEDGERRVQGNLAFVGLHSINGVSALHTELMKKTVFADLHKLYPDRINNKTNGITPRRWLIQCNPGLTALAEEAIGGAFLDDVTLLKICRSRRMPLSAKKFAAAKGQQGALVVNLVGERLGIRVGPSARSTSRSNASTSTSATPRVETVALYDQIRARTWNAIDAAREILRRQGRAELSQRQAHHAFRQRCGQGDQPRPGSAGPGRRLCSARTTMSAWPRS